MILSIVVLYNLKYQNYLLDKFSKILEDNLNSAKVAFNRLIII